MKLNIDFIYPVGSIYMSVNATNPGTLFGGTWERWGNGRVPVGVDTSQSEFEMVEQTGGSKANNHDHWMMSSFDGSSLYFETTRDDGTFDPKYSNNNTRVIQTKAVMVGGLGQPYNGNMREDATSKTEINILQPYITCYMWKRTA